MEGVGRAGYVLVGGRSSRMGRDKALLAAGPRTLVEQTADYVKKAAGNATLIGSPERYAFLGLPVIADRVEGHGPLGGLYTALRDTTADWNLIVACDMPGITPDFLRTLFEAAEKSGKECLVPVVAGGLEPLCAIYHARVLSAAESAVKAKRLKMQDFVRGLDAVLWPIEDAHLVRNLNTPEELAAELK
ncbi:MAG: molybdenum cofactor guanylyltransferase [Bryobacterales bacterium]|nr:molybdenum cofactor guanylyltransferase [Bryobacterales bacterium]MBV9399855.1 molybdenum cofactor guanylyltransferase [Bryobacterales bacterium]